MSAKDPLVLYPTRIRDAQGNIILIIYRTDRAPEIDNIVDTVGRGLRFHYNSNQLLTAITGEGYAGGPSRVIAQLHYSRIDLKLRDAFAGRVITRDCTPQGGEPVVEPCPWMLDAVFYSGTKTGFWMGSSRNNDSAYRATECWPGKVSNAACRCPSARLTPIWRCMSRGRFRPVPQHGSATTITR